MKLSFDDIFKAEPLSEMKVQKIVIKKLNKDLPSNDIEYTSTGNGYCALTTKKDKLNISGFKFCLNKEDKNILGEKPSVNDIINYSYNSQKPLKLKLKEEGYIIINGQKMEINKVVFKPLSNIRIIEESLYAYPPEFPVPFNVSLSCGKFERILKVKRMPNNSISILSFESKSEEPLILKYTLLEEKEKINIGLSYNFEYAKCIKDLVECANIYNGFFEGKAQIFNSPIREVKIDEKNKINNGVIRVWEKVYELEQYLDLSFDTSILDLDDETRDIVEKLYYGLIKKKPIRENKHLTSATFEENIENSDMLIGKEMHLEFEGTNSFELFGEKFDVHCVIGLYGAKIEEIYLVDEKYKVLFSDAKNDVSAFMVLRYFKSKKQLKDYRKTVTGKQIAKMHTARTALEYYEEDKEKSIK